MGGSEFYEEQSDPQKEGTVCCNKELGCNHWQSCCKVEGGLKRTETKKAMKKLPWNLLKSTSCDYYPLITQQRGPRYLLFEFLQIPFRAVLLVKLEA